MILDPYHIKDFLFQHSLEVNWLLSWRLGQNQKNKILQLVTLINTKCTKLTAHTTATKSPRYPIY